MTEGSFSVFTGTFLMKGTIMFISTNLNKKKLYILGFAEFQQQQSSNFNFESKTKISRLIDDTELV